MGQCCAKGEVGGKAAETEDKEPVKKKEEPQDNEVVVRNGVMYDEFCDLVLTVWFFFYFYDCIFAKFEQSYCF